MLGVPDEKGYVQVEGEVIQSLPSAIFKVKLENDMEILCHISGKIRKNNINIVPGDKVMVDIPVADPTKGRIVFRMRQ